MNAETYAFIQNALFHQITRGPKCLGALCFVLKGAHRTLRHWNQINKIGRRHNRCVLKNTVYVRSIVKGAPKSASFISISTIYFTRVYRTGTGLCLSINAPLKSSNHSLKGVCDQISRDQVDHGVSSKLLSRVDHQQESRHLSGPKRFSDLSVLTPEKSANKFCSRNDSAVPGVC